MIIFFYGEDDFRAKKKVRELRERFEREVDRAGGGFEHLDGEKITLREINEKAAVASLLAPKRMIVIENIFRNKNKNILAEVKEYFANKEKNGQDNVVVFLENFIKTKQKFSSSEPVKMDLDGREKPLNKAEKELFKFLHSAKVKQEFKKMNNFEMSGWIKKEAEQRGGKINSKAVAALITLTAGDLWQIDNEINKLVSYTQEGNEILEDDVKNLVRGNFEENIFALTDAIGNRQKSLAVKLLEEELLSGANEVYVLSMITRQIKIILQVASALSSGLSQKDLAQELKLNPYVVKKAAAQARNFSPHDLKKMLTGLIEIDHKIKSGQGKVSVFLGLWLSGI